MAGCLWAVFKEMPHAYVDSHYLPWYSPIREWAIQRLDISTLNFDVVSVLFDQSVKDGSYLSEKSLSWMNFNRWIQISVGERDKVINIDIKIELPR